jgi:ribonuclease HII
MQNRVELGIDEAGRGAVIGPMVVAGVRADRREVSLLRRIGVRDSKKLSPRVRERMYGEIIELVEGHMEKVYSAQEIDKNSLTALELDGISHIIGALRVPPGGKIVIDCIGKLAKDRIQDRLKIPEEVEFVYESKADDCYTVCQAASIVAKVVRDREIRRIQQRIRFDFGKGYPTKTTNDFIREYRDEHGTLPPEIRKRWGNLRKMSW